MSALVGSLAEAWAEVRVHRARVVLSLVGVVLAVFAMTVVTAAGILVRQVVQESTERSSGRDTTLAVYAYSPDGSVTPAEIDAFFAGTVQRYGIEHSSRVLTGSVGLDPEGGQGVQVTAVEPAYGVIHRIVAEDGRWLSTGDAERLLPAVVVNRSFLEVAGAVGRPVPFAADLPGTDGQQVVVVGTTTRDEWGPTLWTPIEDAEAFGISAATGGSALEVWVPPDRADGLITEIRALGAAEGLEADAQPSTDPTLGTVLTVIQLIILALSLFALFLGSLGVLNVGVVTVRQRVREIGVRRALGASGGRVFAAVMLESVLATVLAGLVGIAVAVAVVSNAPLELLPDELAITDDPPFPWAAAAQAFAAATLVGALAGLVPAVMAVRTKVIDAIRY